VRMARGGYAWLSRRLVAGMIWSGRVKRATALVLAQERVVVAQQQSWWTSLGSLLLRSEAGRWWSLPKSLIPGGAVAA
jgi:hypothetical protein